MNNYAITENGTTFKYAILTTKVFKVINHIELNQTVRKKDYEIIERGTQLLTQILEGSILIEKKPNCASGISPSIEGLFAYEHALSAIEKLNLIVMDSDITQLFLVYRNNMLALFEHKALNKDDLSILKNFFSVLGQLFYEDILDDTYNRQNELIPMLMS